MKSLNQREKRALMLLAVGGAVGLFLLFQPPSGQAPAVVSSSSIQMAEKRLRRLQDLARQKPRTAADAESAARALAEAEKGLLKGTTPALASAEMQQLMKELLQAQSIALQSSEFNTPKAVGEDYAQVPLAVNFNCGVEQWINLMAAVRNAPQVLSTLEVRMSPADPKNKSLHVRMVVAGYIPASLLAGAKGTAGP